MDYNIRFATAKDLDQIVLLCAAHAAYEKCDYCEVGKKEGLHKAFFNDQPSVFCLVVEMDNKLIGYATYMAQYSTWDAQDYIYMDCLYMQDGHRSLGIGTQIMNRIQSEGKKLGCNHIQWQTPDFNTKAIKFYKRIGAYSKEKERFFWAID